MGDDLHKYIRQARDSGADHQTIKDRLVGAGWHPQTVSDALHQHGASEQSAPPTLPVNTRSQTPIAVVQALSTRGVEYYFMIIALAVVAVSLAIILHNIASSLFDDGKVYAFNTATMTGASSALIVSLPLFIFFFLRLKKAELQNPSLLLDPSRRRAIQILLIVTFVVGLISVISYVIAFFSLTYGGNDESPTGLIIADFVISTLIVGGVFANYWMDSHQKGAQ